jgi:hypothetical protein
MANYFLDTSTGSDSDNGTTMDLAFATLKFALEGVTYLAGDILWVRRTLNEVPTADITPIGAGSTTALRRVIGWPRNTHAITSSDWTNGSTSVTVDDADMTRAQHQGRYITAPDSNTYLITRVVDASTIIIDREYAGTTVTNQAATIQADEDYALAQAIDDSAWTIKKTTWNADADSLPLLDFNDGAYQLILSQRYFWDIRNMEFKDSTDANAIIYMSINRFISFVGCLFRQTTANNTIFRFVYAVIIMRRCIFEGSGSGANQRGIYGSASDVHLIDCAIYNCGDLGLSSYDGATIKLENVNIGVEQANGDHDIGMIAINRIYGRDVRLGGAVGYIVYTYANPMQKVQIENYQKVLGAHRTFYPGGYYEKQAVPDGVICNKKISDYVIKLTPNSADGNFTASADCKHQLLEHEIEATTASKSYRYWIFNNAMGTLNDTTAYDNIYLSAEYITAYDDTTEYIVKTIYSSQIDIANAANADDWDYLEVTGVAPATASKVRLSIYVGAYSATGTIYIDPCPVIS